MCSRRGSGNAFERASRLTRFEGLRSGGKGRGDSVGVGKTRDIEEISWRVVFGGFVCGSTNAGHSSNVFRVSISLELVSCNLRLVYLGNDITQIRDFEHLCHFKEKSHKQSLQTSNSVSRHCLIPKCLWGGVEILSGVGSAVGE